MSKLNEEDIHPHAQSFQKKLPYTSRGIIMGFFRNKPEYLGNTAVLPVLSVLPVLTLITSMLNIFHFKISN